jgi:hypothetical protein
VSEQKGEDENDEGNGKIGQSFPAKKIEGIG